MEQADVTLNELQSGSEKAKMITGVNYIYKDCCIYSMVENMGFGNLVHYSFKDIFLRQSFLNL